MCEAADRIPSVSFCHKLFCIDPCWLGNLTFVTVPHICNKIIIKQTHYPLLLSSPFSFSNNKLTLFSLHLLPYHSPRQIFLLAPVLLGAGPSPKVWCQLLQQSWEYREGGEMSVWHFPLNQNIFVTVFFFFHPNPAFYEQKRIKSPSRSRYGIEKKSCLWAAESCL